MRWVDRVAENFSAVLWRSLAPETDPQTLAAELANLLSRGAPPELPQTRLPLEEKYKRTRSRALNGLNPDDALALLRLEHLSAPEAWPALVEIYRGHPGWLKAAARATQTWFGGNAAEFVSFGGWLSEGVLASLNELCDRLTDSERRILCFLARQGAPVAIASLRQAVNLSPAESLAPIESLRRRSLLEIDRSNPATTARLIPVLRAWTTETLARQMEAET